ncbi:hypothetical protein CRUP_038176, partial [Coryphaenoides rupestris]
PPRAGVVHRALLLLLLLLHAGALQGGHRAAHLQADLLRQRPLPGYLRARQQHHAHRRERACGRHAHGARVHSRRVPPDLSEWGRVWLQDSLPVSSRLHGPAVPVHQPAEPAGPSGSGQPAARLPCVSEDGQAEAGWPADPLGVHPPLYPGGAPPSLLR